MAEIQEKPIWETWESIHQKAGELGHTILEHVINMKSPIDKIAVVPRGGLYIVNMLARQLGLSGDQVISLGISRYDLDHPTHAGEFKIGQLPTVKDVEGLNVLLADEVNDTGETTKRAKDILLELGAGVVLTAAVHYKPGQNTTGEEPDFFVEATNAWVHYPWEVIDRIGDMHRAAVTNQTNE